MKIVLQKVLLVFFIFTIGSLSAQVGVGTTTPQGALDVLSPTSGIVIPRVLLTSKIIAAPVVNPNGGGIPIDGTLIYNTATAGAAPNNVVEGFYYWDNNMWNAFTGVGSKEWSIDGNAGTNAATNFLGTTDAQDLKIRTNSIERMAVSATSGNVAIGTTTIPATTRLEVSSGASNDAISGHSNNVGGVLGKEINISFGTPAQSLLGSGVYANNPTAGYTSCYAQSTGSATVAANISFSDVWMASYNYVQNGSSGFNPSANYNQLNVTNAALAGDQIALRGFSSRGTTAGNPGFTIGVDGTADTQTQDAIGIQGTAFTNSTTRAGGYFESYNYAGAALAYAWVGTNVGGIARKITGTNAVSEIIPTENHGRITMTAPECPEYWYQDYGTVNMVDGKATIVLDPVLADIIVVDEQNPIRVICTPVGMPYYNGITIMAQTSSSVEILELNGGSHSGKLQYQITVRPKTGYGEGRYPQAAGPSYLKSDKEPLAAKAKNQPADRKIFYWPSDHEVYKYNPEDMISIGDVIPAGPNFGKVKLAGGKYGSITAEKPKAR